MGGGRGEFMEFTAGLTCVMHEVGLEGCSLAEAAEGEMGGWRAVELLGAGLAENSTDITVLE